MAHFILQCYDQVSLLREELSKKDKLIADLTSVEIPRVSRHVDTTQVNKNIEKNNSVNTVENHNS